MKIRLPRLRRLAAATGGATAIEFALVAAFLILPLTIGVYDFGTALFHWMQVGNAARAGAQFINVNGYSSTYTTVGNTCPSASTNTFTCAVQAATGLGSNVTVKVGPAYCGCQNGTAYTGQIYAPPCNACSSSITTDCCTTGTPVTLAQVNASYAYVPIFCYIGFGACSPDNPISIGASATALLY